MKTLITTFLVVFTTTIFAHNPICNINQKKRMSYSKYCKKNHIKTTKVKVKPLEIKIISSGNMTTALVPMFK